MLPHSQEYISKALRSIRDRGWLCACALSPILGPTVAEAQVTCRYPAHPAAVAPAGRDTLIASCRERIRQTPGDSTTYLVLESQLLDRPEERLAVILGGLRIAPRNVQLWGNLGLTYRQLGRGIEALAALRKATLLAPHDSNWPTQAGLVAHDLARFGEALILFDEAIERDPSDGAPWGFRARTLRRLGRHTEAVRSWDRAEELTPHGFIDEAGDRDDYERSGREP